LALGLSHQVSTPSWIKTHAWFGIAGTRGAAVSPTSTEFTRMVSQPGAQFNKSDASADSATPASIVKLYVLMPIIKRVDQ